MRRSEKEASMRCTSIRQETRSSDDERGMLNRDFIEVNIECLILVRVGADMLPRLERHKMMPPDFLLFCAYRLLYSVFCSAATTFGFPACLARSYSVWGAHRRKRRSF